MSDLENIVNTLKINKSADAVSYVYYVEETGKIVKVSNRHILDSEYSILEVPLKDIEPIVKGEKRTDEYVVDYDVSLKQTRLKLVTYEDSHDSAATMTYQAPVVYTDIIQGLDCIELIDGKQVYVWHADFAYKKGSLVWKERKVVKISADTQKGEELSEHNSRIILSDVSLAKPDLRSETKIIHFEPQYEGIHVDVWYNDLEHLEGQHVWLNNNVYRILDYQAPDTFFNIKNAEIVARDVKLMEDKNPNLKFGSAVNAGDLVLRNNYLYSVSYKDVQQKKEFVLCYFDESTPFQVDTSINEDISATLGVEVISPETVLQGNLVLIKDKIYRVEKSKDVVVRQNTVKKCWEISLNNQLKNFLIQSKKLTDSMLYFSVTEKHDPNILYRSINFSLSDLLSSKSYVIPFKYDFEFKNTDISIYTAKYFDSYGHEIIK